MTDVIKIGRWGSEIVNTSGYLAADGWRKIGESGGGYNLAYLFNVNSYETASVCIYDYDDPRHEDDFWRNAGTDNDALILHNRHFGILMEGFAAKVVKGRKVPIGYTGKIAKIRKVYNKYGRWVANYAVFESGASTNVNNCVMAD